MYWCINSQSFCSKTFHTILNLYIWLTFQWLMTRNLLSFLLCTNMHLLVLLLHRFCDMPLYMGCLLIGVPLQEACTVTTWVFKVHITPPSECSSHPFSVSPKVGQLFMILWLVFKVIFTASSDYQEWNRTLVTYVTVAIQTLDNGQCCLSF